MKRTEDIYLNMEDARQQENVAETKEVAWKMCAYDALIVIAFMFLLLAAIIASGYVKQISAILFVILFMYGLWSCA